MPSYIYKARDNQGKLVKGTMEASSKTDLIDKLHKTGYMTTQVTEITPGLKIGSIFEKFNWISESDMLIFYIQLSNMINAGITALASLTAISDQVENRVLKEALGSVARQVEAGSSISQAFGRHPRLFNRLFVNMIKAGEASGKLDTVLIRYADYFERQQDLRQKVKGALIYPLILLCMIVAVCFFIVTFIIPQFASMYLKAGMRLPTLTLIVYEVGKTFKHFWYLGLTLITFIFLGIGLYFKTKRGRLIRDRIKLSLPIIGSLYRKIVISRFSRTLATLTGSGVPILESLDIVRGVSANAVFDDILVNIRSAVERGERIAQTLKKSEEFPLDVVQMISAGEETGNLEGLLNKIADFYDMIIGYAIKKLTTVIEPLALLIMGGMVGLIMASMLMPIFDIIKTLRR